MFTTLVVLFTLLQPLPVLSQDLPSTFPHNYPGKPRGDLSPAYQRYFEVTQPLPNVTFDLGRSFAGNIPVQRAGHPNDTLFFWAFEKEQGSLTASANERRDEPWGIWLNGGPGTSSMYGALFENGPIRVNSDYSITANNFSWNKIADYFWIDQPVGTGFSTADKTGYVADEDQMGRDFLGFLSNLVKVFPSLSSRPLHLTGESYAGVYIPYIMKAYFSMANPPVKIAKIAIGDGSIAEEQVFELLPALSVIETYPQIIGYDLDVYNFFKEQDHLCGYDINLTYPQQSIIKAPPVVQPSDRKIPFLSRLGSKRLSKRSFVHEVSRRHQERGLSETSIAKRDRELKRTVWKRNLAGRSNGTVDSWYGCFLLDEFMDYAVNFTFPWTLSQSNPGLGFGIYYVPDALSPQPNTDASVFLNDPRTRAALHAPTSKDWAQDFEFPLGELTFDPSPVPMTFLSELATNASARGVSVILYSGNDDALIPHRGTEITIQNTTFGGIQGFTRKPATAWHDDSGRFAGIVHQERNWTYVLFDRAGHLVPATNPSSAFTFAREFLFGSNQTGFVASESSVVGGEDPALAVDILPGQDGIYYGAGATQSTYTFPEATVAAWRNFRAAETRLAGVANADSNAADRLFPFVLWTAMGVFLPTVLGQLGLW